MTTPAKPREFTWYNCKASQMVAEGFRTDGKCHQCIEVLHLVERSALEAKERELVECKAERDMHRTDSKVALEKWAALEVLFNKVAAERDQLKAQLESAEQTIKHDIDKIEASYVSERDSALAMLHKMVGELENYLHEIKCRYGNAVPGYTKVYDLLTEYRAYMEKK